MGTVSIIERKTSSGAPEMKNTEDKISHGKAYRGEASPVHKLTEDDVRAIRIAPGYHKIIAAQYEISASQVSLIKSRKTWTWLK